MGNSRIVCFLCEPTERAQHSLRRYTIHDSGDKCPSNYGYHNASVVIGEVGYPHSEYSGESNIDGVSHTDNRWPTRCQHCSYRFKPDDDWQNNLERIYESVDKTKRFPLRQAPVGAMWYHTWSYYKKGPDGKALFVMTPGGDWGIDQDSCNTKTPWTRTGIPPLVTARPSIQIGTRYHGFLTNGVLEEC